MSTDEIIEALAAIGWGYVTLSYVRAEHAEFIDYRWSAAAVKLDQPDGATCLDHANGATPNEALAALYATCAAVTVPA